MRTSHSDERNASADNHIFYSGLDKNMFEGSPRVNTTSELQIDANTDVSNVSIKPLEACQQAISLTSLDVDSTRVSATDGRKRPRAVSEDGHEDGDASNFTPHNKTLCIQGKLDSIALLSTQESDGENIGGYQNDCMSDDSDIDPELIEACNFLRSVGLG
eukprot:CAMPEP_0195516382 /NCGR_PEP_ID=MMETSP0794_2-20130614/7125_1 /TAXON_ID=515487 /ORGANISM="Stephanopyxis turris, Strain CCMP 815" /LENGTH=159 /DNA_ID=CAMNT_0040644963 /DNA_START=235 /DNA_END=714 /DNA_ORIENTATION=-